MKILIGITYLILGLVSVGLLQKLDMVIENKFPKYVNRGPVFDNEGEKVLVLFTWPMVWGVLMCLFATLFCAWAISWLITKKCEPVVMYFWNGCQKQKKLQGNLDTNKERK